MGEPDLVASGGGGRGGSPPAGGVDGLAVAIEPAAELAQRLLLEVGDAAGAVRADVDQQVAAIGYDVDQQVDQLGAGQGSSRPSRAVAFSARMTYGRYRARTMRLLGTRTWSTGR